MEKTKNIAGWHQRLLRRHTKPASQITFKQYCHEYEIQMKVLYPFLPQEQVKGKLFARWKKFQPQHQDTCIKKRTQTLTKPQKLPVVLFSKAKHQRATLEKKHEDRFDWLNVSGSSVPGNTGKTYEGRGFALPPKVPKIISESSNPERSILKNTSCGGNILRERRQPASQVSFTVNDQECPSPQLYSPPTPFVLSPLSDDGQVADVRPHHQTCFPPTPFVLSYRSDDAQVADVQPQQQTCFAASPVKLSSTATSKSAEKKRVNTALGNPTGNETVARPSRPQKKTNQELNTILLKEPRTDASERKLEGRRPKKGRKSQRNDDRVTPAADDTQLSSQLSSQFLEPPKFSTVPRESVEEKEKRFCLFEDEFVKPGPRGKKKKPANRKSRSPKQKTKREPLYSWSPALGCSQYTPKLKKAGTSLFPTQKETYHHSHRQPNTRTKRRQLLQKPHCTKPARKFDKRVSHVSTNSSKSASPRRMINNQRRTTDVPTKKVGKRYDKIHKAQSDHISFCEQTAEEFLMHEEYEDELHTNRMKTNTVEIKPITKQGADEQEIRRARPRRSTLRADSNAVAHKPSAALPQVEDQKDGISGTIPRSLKHRFNSPERNKEIMNSSDIDSPVYKEKDVTAYKPYTKCVPSGSEKQTCTEEEEKDIELTAPSPCLASPSDPKALFPEQQRMAKESISSPRESQGTDLLRRILLQLKNTAVSSQNGDPLSPTQSRMIEASGMSVKSLSSNGPSPTSTRDVRDLMDDLQSTEEAAPESALTTVRDGNTYRKRGNVLCNLFDAPDSDIVMPTKTKRYLPSALRPIESDLNILFSADIFV